MMCVPIHLETSPTLFLMKEDYHENVTFQFAVDGMIYFDSYFSFGYSSYNISVYNVPVAWHQTTGTVMHHSHNAGVTRLARQCRGSSSDGARVNIIAGCVVAALFVIMGSRLW